MNKGILIVIILAALGIGGYLVYQSSLKGAATAAAAPATRGPQPGDPILDADASPNAVMGAVAAIRKKEDQDAEAANWVGQWLPATGWNGPVEAISDEKGGKVYRMRFSASGLLTNEFWVIAVVPEGSQYYKGFEPAKRDFITVGGRIDKVEVIPPSGGYKPLPDYRIVLKDAYVMSITGK